MPTHPKRKISASRAESPPDPEPDQSESADHDVASFIALCETENIDIPSTLATLPKMQAFIRHASLAFDCTHLPRAQVREHVASLLWLRAHHNSPDDMRLLPHILWCQLWALYNIPSHFHSAANNYIRLSQWSTCNSPSTSSNFSHEQMPGTDDSGASAGADPPRRHTRHRGSPSTAAQAPPPKSAARRQRDTFPLDTRRPPDDDGEMIDEPRLDLTSQYSAGSPSHHGSHHHHHPSHSHHSLEHLGHSVSFRQQLSEELHHRSDVFQVIDLTRLLQESARLLKITACAKKNSQNSRDNENSPEFSILTRFHLVTGAPVDMLQRGILLSQSSVLPSLIPDSALVKSNAEVITGKLFTAFDSSKSSWGLDCEIGGSIISKFREFILERYRYRLEIAHRDYSDCPILLSHCLQQSQELTSSGLDKNFFAQVDLHIAHISRHPDGRLNFLVFNRAHLQLLYPSVREFIYLLPHASSSTIAAEIEDICTGGIVSQSPPAVPSSMRAKLPRTVVPPTPTLPISSKRPAWVGLPFDKDVLGTDLGLDPPPRNPCYICGAPHYAVNCPQQYFATCKERCPGFNHKGEKIPSAWTGTILTPATRKDWEAYITRHRLIRSRYASSDVKF
jgi:hypothetical protein